ncbi:hypothetical protein OJAV_G00209010 [Oryzias javanicus]|uniref:L1 transposable element RRM domain-containing protein n=1 Tax=Oryzias javanicus TaxID=123683 RepID=A0A3S2LPI9_ORYJA|nr:hypothetical protein OJAV_G00209010 [Oryzias javanicus]
MPQKKTSRSRTQQSNLSNFATKLIANGKAMEASAGAAANAGEQTGTTGGSDASLGGIMTAINNMKTEFSSRFDDISAAIEGVRKDIKDCSERVAQAEVRISATEDNVTELYGRMKRLEGKNKELEDKVLDLEARSRRSNVRLVGLPEGAEGSDICGFLEGWIPEVLELGSLRGKLAVERAHRLGPPRERGAPRTLIVNFLSYKDKEMVMKAARAKRQILFKNQQVRFYQDMAAEMHKKLKEFEGARRQLRSLGLRYGMIPPARLILTYKNHTHIFNKAEEAEEFIKKIRSENQQN